MSKLNKVLAMSLTTLALVGSSSSIFAARPMSKQESASSSKKPVKENSSMFVNCGKTITSSKPILAHLVPFELNAEEMKNLKDDLKTIFNKYNIEIGTVKVTMLETEDDKIQKKIQKKLKKFFDKVGEINPDSHELKEDAFYHIHQNYEFLCSLDNSNIDETQKQKIKEMLKLYSEKVIAYYYPNGNYSGRINEFTPIRVLDVLNRLTETERNENPIFKKIYEKITASFTCKSTMPTSSTLTKYN